MIIPKNITDLPDELRSIATMVDSMFDEVYLVGGAVRDAILGRKTDDLDFTTPENAAEIERVLSTNKALRVHKEGVEFGTVSAYLEPYDIQVTSYRSEEYMTNSRRPIVKGAIDIDSDLSRRDFTINSIALSAEEIVDPYGGLGDIEKKVIKAVGQAETKFKEDPLRILRAFRFVATLGFDIDEDTLAAIVRMKDNLQIVSSERIGVELNKLIQGDYWADTLNELSETGVLNSILKSLDITYRVTPEDVKHEFEGHSLSELVKMDVIERWLYLIRIFAYAERASGVTSSDVESLAEKFLIKVQVSKRVRNEIIELLSQTDTKQNDPDKILDENIAEAKRQTILLKDIDDPRSMIEEAKYYTLLGQKNIVNSQYGLARKNYKTALDITDKNFKFILSFQDEEKKKIKLRGLTSYYKTRLQYYITSMILDEKLHTKFQSTDKLEQYLQKEIKTTYINKDVLKDIMERSIAYVYRRRPHDISLEPYYEFLTKRSSALDSETKSRYLSQYIELEIRNPSTPPSEKADLYLRKAKNAVKDKAEAEYGLEYFDPYIDFLYNKMLSQKSLDKLRLIYSDFDQAARQYMEVTVRERRPWIGKRKYHLTSASSLIHALSLAETIEEKLNISKEIVADYAEAGRGFEKNVARYRVYEDWFTFVKELLAAKYSKDENDLKKLQSMLLRSQSRTYVDIDEEYLETYRQDIISKRKILQDSYLFINIILGKKNYTVDITNEVLRAIAKLYTEGLLDSHAIFSLFKNYISSDENQGTSDEVMQIEDKQMLDKDASELREYLTGESETIEYKSSWKFNVNRYRAKAEVTEDEKLKWEVMKNIAGLANKRGGTLLIGVEDDRTVCGLEQTDFLLYSDEQDHLKILDRIDREIRNEINNKLGSELFAVVSMDTLKYENKTVIRIKIPKADPLGAVIYRDGDNEIYYVRSGKSTNNPGMRALLGRASAG